MSSAIYKGGQEARICGGGRRPEADASCVPSSGAFGEWASRKRALVFSILANMMVFVLLFLFLVPGFETNDDLTMRLIASGFYTGHPSEYLVFTNVLIGLVLKNLYLVAGTTNWYVLYLVGAHFAGLTALSFLFLKHRQSRRSVLVCVAFSLLIEVRLFLNLQFTTTAFLLGVAGVFLLVDGMARDESVLGAEAIAGFTFLALATMIRDSAVLLLGAIAFPFLVVRFRRLGWWRLLTIIAVSAVLFVGLTSFNRWYYHRRAAWAEFFEYNRIRGEFHGTPLQWIIPQAGKDVGWTANDATMFVGCYFAEPKVYAGVTRMRELRRSVHALVVPQGLVGRFGPRDLCLADLVNSEAAPLFGLGALSCGLCVWVAGTKRRECVVSLLLLYLTFVILCFYLRETARLPPRVSYNMPLFLFCLAMYWGAVLPRPHSLSSAEPVRSHRQRGTLHPWSLPATLIFFAYFILVILFCRVSWNTADHNRFLRRQSGALFRFAASLPAAGHAPIIIPLPHDSLFEQSLFFFDGNRPAFTVVPYGWLSHSPIFDQILREHDLLPYSTSVVHRHDTFFLMENRWIEPLKTFYREHYGETIRFQKVADPAKTSGPGYSDADFYRAEPGK